MCGGTIDLPGKVTQMNIIVFIDYSMRGKNTLIVLRTRKRRGRARYVRIPHEYIHCLYILYYIMYTNAPSSNYTVYGYDIEDNALPNSLPAVVILLSTLITVRSKRYH